MSEIVSTPNAVLKQIAKPIHRVDKKLLNIIQDMMATLEAAKNPEGVGLAAPQIGLSLRIFVMRPSHRSKTKIFINPEISNLSKDTQSPDVNDGVYEGCLSIPHHYAPIARSMSLTLKYQTLNPKNTSELITKTEDFTGFPAHIIQHEVDHLNGILFTDHVLSQSTKLYKIKGKTWEEVDL